MGELRIKPEIGEVSGAGIHPIKNFHRWRVNHHSSRCFDKLVETISLYAGGRVKKIAESKVRVN